MELFTPSRITVERALEPAFYLLGLAEPTLYATCLLENPVWAPLIETARY